MAEIRKNPLQRGDLRFSGGELGIRTPDTLVAYTRLAGEHLRPLGQLSNMISAICYDTVTIFKLQGA